MWSVGGWEARSDRRSPLRQRGVLCRWSSRRIDPIRRRRAAPPPKDGGAEATTRRQRGQLLSIPFSMVVRFARGLFT